MIMGLAQLPVGLLADSMVGHRANILALSLVAMGAAYFLLGSPVFASALLGSGLIGLGTALWHPTAAASLSNRFPGRRATALWIHGTGATISDTITPLFVGALLASLSWETVAQLQLCRGCWLLSSSGALSPGSLPTPIPIRRTILLNSAMLSALAQSLILLAQTRSIVFFRLHAGAQRFLLTLMALIGEQLQLGAPGALSFLAANPGDLLLLGGLSSSELGFELVKQDSPGEKTIKRLRALLLALHANTGRPVIENNTARYLINILAAGSRRSNESFFQVLLSNT
jgi:MFS family permease